MAEKVLFLTLSQSFFFNFHCIWPEWHGKLEVEMKMHGKCLMKLKIVEDVNLILLMWTRCHGVGYLGVHLIPRPRFWQIPCISTSKFHKNSLRLPPPYTLLLIIVIILYHTKKLLLIEIQLHFNVSEKRN